MPAPLTIRQKFVDAAIARMQLILVANGYQTDLGQNVADWRTNWEQEELPGVGVFDLTNEAEKDHFGAKRQTNKLRMQFRIFGAKDPAEFRVMIADVIKAIKVDPRWGGLAVESHPGNDGFILPNESFEVAGAAIEIMIEFLSNTFDPYV